MQASKKTELSQIDCFHWEELDKHTYKLTYYDPAGKRAERTISKSALDSALRLFDGKTHLIRRSSGAYSPALPSKLMIYHEPNQATSSSYKSNILKVNAQFLDFERNSEGQILSNKLVVQNKNVSPESFRILAEKDDPYVHQYWLDLGQSIIPVSVFDFFRSEDELVRASFVLTEELKAISKNERGKKIAITVYSAPESVLRLSLPDELSQVIEAHTSTRSIQTMNPSEAQKIPEFLTFGSPVLVPTGSSMEVLKHYLRVCQDPHSVSMKQTFLSVLEKPIEKPEETQLMPFGVFERL